MAEKVTKVGSFAKSLTDYTRLCLEEGETLRLLFAYPAYGFTIDQMNKMSAAGVRCENGFGWNIVVKGAEGFNKVAEKLDGFENNGFYRVRPLFS